jgi:hypothetical protein
MKQLIIGAIALCASLGASAQDHAVIDKSQIIGNRELPKVLYIVPWKKPAPGDLTGRPMQSVLDEAMAPLDKDVFQRQVKYDSRPLAPQTSVDQNKDHNKDQNKDRQPNTK